MNTKERALAAEMLQLASDSYANHGCNDWEFPKDWTRKERQQFIRDFQEWNGDPEEREFLNDFEVMAFLAHKIEQGA